MIALVIVRETVAYSSEDQQKIIHAYGQSHNINLAHWVFGNFDDANDFERLLDGSDVVIAVSKTTAAEDQEHLDKLEAILKKKGIDLIFVRPEH